MKNIKKLIVATSLFIGSLAFAQAPEKISYQAVVRNTTNNLVTNQPVGMQISILQGSATGTAVYVETQTPTSNANGLVSLEIGGGTVVSGNMATINWVNGPYFIKTETDPTGGSSYTITGTSQLLSAPYALYAKTSGSSTPGPAGPAGPQGPAGANGLDGATGSMGPQGPVGANGLDGATGPMGPQGIQGPAGPAGANGLDGATGPMGPQGPQGPAGANGLDGATGPMGPQGIQGPAGAAGANGLDGATGPMGPQGIQGPAGPAGANGLDGVTGPQGPAGANGLDGATGPMGPQGPQGPAGANGLDGATGPMGPQGPAGANGLDGATGPMGPQGPAGANGLDGATGPMGPQGPAGANGLDGATGPMGSQGPAGANGLDGATGPMGPQGPQGPAGTSGANGQGVPVGGATGQVLSKVDGTDYNTQWVTPSAGGSGPTLLVRASANSAQNINFGSNFAAPDPATCFGSVSTNVGSAFNSVTGVFTAPSAGLYLITIQVASSNNFAIFPYLDVDNNFVHGNTATSATDFFGVATQNTASMSSSANNRGALSAQVYLNAGQVAGIKFQSPTTAAQPTVRTDGATNFTIVKLL